MEQDKHTHTKNSTNSFLKSLRGNDANMLDYASKKRDSVPTNKTVLLFASRSGPARKAFILHYDVLFCFLLEIVFCCCILLNTFSYQLLIHFHPSTVMFRRSLQVAITH